MMTAIIFYKDLITSGAIYHHWMDGLIDIYDDLLHKILTKLTKINWRLTKDQSEMLKDYHDWFFQSVYSTTLE